MRLIKQDRSPTPVYVFESTFHDQMPDGRPARKVAGESGFIWTRLVPNHWATEYPSVAIALAAYADDGLRAELLEKAKAAPNPREAWLTYEDRLFVFRTPLVDYWKWNKVPKDCLFNFTMEPQPHWWTADASAAIKLYAEFRGKEHFRVEEGLVEKFKSFQERREERLEASRATDADVDIPCPMGLSYLPFQKAAIAYAMKRPSTLFGDEMGLGKTVMSVGVINADEAAKRVLVICPASLKYNWQRELRKWLVHPRTVGIGTSQFIPTTDVVIVNYEALGKRTPTGKQVFDKKKKAFVEEYDHILRRKLRETEWDILIIDEAHRLKSEKAIRTKLAFSIRRKRLLCLTGTPIPNRPRELWPLLSNLAPAVFNNWKRFMERYCFGGSNAFGVNYDGACNLEELQEKMREHIMVRRLKSEVLKELPPKRRQVIELPATGLDKFLQAERNIERERREAIRQMRLRVELAKASDDPEEYKQAVHALRAASVVAFTEMSKVRHETAVAKVPLVVEHLESVLEEQEKVIVFAHHKDVMLALKAHFGESAVMIYGDIKMQERDEAVERFQNDPTARVFIGGIMAAGVGLTLTAASVVVFAELDWTPGNITQAEDRAHRIGATANHILVQHLVLEDSMDAKMARLLVEKQEVADRALDNETGLERVQIEDAPDDELEEIVLPEKAEACAPVVAERPRTRIMLLPEERFSTHGTTREQLEREALELSEDDISALHMAVKSLAQVCDGAQERDAMGFNGPDVSLGHELARRPSLTAQAAALAKHLLFKYRKTQLDGSLDHLYERS